MAIWLLKKMRNGTLVNRLDGNRRGPIGGRPGFPAAWVAGLVGPKARKVVVPVVGRRFPDEIFSSPADPIGGVCRGPAAVLRGFNLPKSGVLGSRRQETAVRKQATQQEGANS